ncbi:MAG: molybdenum cofactor biosynthesis protein MoeB, partial [Candidatus Aenigmarchaeota archaeon]|nr:molybdenum cofactor biosynthesis protein MoeB [Candidatus Aenigmarchaeota archaeon]
IRDLAERVGELDKTRFYITQCHTGVRSLHAQHFLQEKGFKARSLAGGIERWATEIDPTIGHY